MAASPHRLTGTGRRARRWPTVLLAVAGLACLVVGVALLLRGPSAGAEDLGAVPAPVPTASPTADAPDAPAPEAGAVPVELLIPGRGVAAPVVAVGTGRDGGLVIPDPPSTVGWWTPSALAGGAAGPTVLAGHIDSRTAGIGALAVLRQVVAGEPVVVRGADGRSVRYAVSARREYLKADLPEDVFAPAGRPGLVLITCGGPFDRTTGHYEDNVVVFAEPVA